MLMRTVPAVYLAAPIQARHDSALSYEWLVRAVADAGATVLNPEVAHAAPPDLETMHHATAICGRNRASIEGTEILVAEVSLPSHGVGIEIARAEARNLPIICLWREGSPPLSKMILGMDHPLLQVLEYNSEAAGASLLRAAFALLRARAEPAHTGPYRDRLLDHFSALAPAYDHSTQWREAPMLRSWVRDRLPPAQLVLDLGSGTGILAREVAAGTQVVRVDLCADMLRKGGTIGAVVADVHALPLPTGVADVVIMRQVLHYTDEVECLREVHRVLRPGGRFLLAQVTAATDRSRRWWAELKNGVQPLRNVFYSHVQLIDMLDAAGFTAVEASTLRLRRTDPWERFVVNASPRAAEFASSLLRATPSDLAQEIELVFEQAQVRYAQHWTLLDCRKAGGAP